jgi:hypothetical protein
MIEPIQIVKIYSENLKNFKQVKKQEDKPKKLKIPGLGQNIDVYA